MDPSPVATPRLLTSWLNGAWALIPNIPHTPTLTQSALGKLHLPGCDLPLLVSLLHTHTSLPFFFLPLFSGCSGRWRGVDSTLAVSKGITYQVMAAGFEFLNIRCYFFSIQMLFFNPVLLALCLGGNSSKGQPYRLTVW